MKKKKKTGYQVEKDRITGKIAGPQTEIRNPVAKEKDEAPLRVMRKMTPNFPAKRGAVQISYVKLCIVIKMRLDFKGKRSLNVLLSQYY